MQGRQLDSQAVPSNEAVSPQDQRYLHTHERTCLVPGFALCPQYEVEDVTHLKIHKIKGKET